MSLANHIVTRLGGMWWMALGALLGLTMIQESSHPLPVDTTVFHWLDTSGFPHLHSLWVAVSWPGDELAMVILMVLAAATGLWWTGHRRAAWVLPLIFFAAQLSNLGLKALLERPRPIPDNDILFGPDQFSFPSGHVVQYVCLFGFLAWWGYWCVNHRLAKIALIAMCGFMILLVGPSRLYMDSHWISDVMAGYLYGFLWLRAAILLTDHHFPQPAAESPPRSGSPLQIHRCEGATKTPPAPPPPSEARPPVAR